MWEHQCSATRKDGQRCTRPSHWAFQCFEFQGERYQFATWIEVCGHHQDKPRSVVSILKIWSKGKK